MHDTLDPGMIEATRLTRAGRLIEATALLQRMLHTATAPDAASNAAAETSRVRTEWTTPAISPGFETISGDGSAALPAHRPHSSIGGLGARGRGCATARTCRAEQVARSRQSARLRLGITWLGGTNGNPPAGHRAGWRTVHYGDLQQPRREPCLQALHSEWLSWPGAPPGGHAAWLHPRRRTISPPAPA